MPGAGSRAVGWQEALICLRRLKVGQIEEATLEIEEILGGALEAEATQLLLGAISQGSK